MSKRFGPWGNFFEGRFSEGEEGQGWFGPRHHGRFRFGRMDRGDVKYLILSVLKDGPKHGYEIIKEIEQRSKEAYSPSPGTIYPTLQMLEDLGHVRSVQKDERRVYEITDAGRAYLAEHQAEADEAWSRFEGWDWKGMFGKPEQHELRRELMDVARALFAGGRIFRADAKQLGEVGQALRQARDRIEEILR